MNGTNDAIYDGTPMTGWTETVEPCDGGISPWWILAAVAVALLLVGGSDKKGER